MRFEVVRVGEGTPDSSMVRPMPGVAHRRLFGLRTLICMARRLALLVLLVACNKDPGGLGGDDSADASVDSSATLDAAPLVASCAGAAASDDFERTTLGSTWMLWVNAECAVNGSDLVQVNPTNWCYAVYSTTFAADQFSEAVISPDKPAQVLTQVFVRQQPVGTPNGNGARYGFHYNADPGKAWWEIKYDGVASAETRVWMNSTAPAPVPGDRLRLEVRGTNPVMLRALHNGVEILAISDSEPQRIATTGHSGVVERPAGSSAPPPANSPVFESWCGGGL